MGSEDLIKDLEAMNKVLGGSTEESKPTPEPKKEPVEEPKPAPESKEEPKPKEGEKEVEVPEPKPEEKEGEKPAGELKPEEKKEPKAESAPDLNKTIVDLRAEIAELRASQQAPKPEEKKPIEEPKVEDHDFVGDLDLDEVSRDPKEFNKLLNNVYRIGMKDSRTAIISELPNLIGQQVEMTNAMRRAGEDFYKQNEDLKAFPKVVALVYDEEVAKDPKRTLADVLKVVGPEVRKRLGLPEPKPGGGSKEEPKEKDPVKGKDPETPSLPSKGQSAGKSRDKPEPDALRAQLDEMSKTLGR